MPDAEDRRLATALTNLRSTVNRMQQQISQLSTANQAQTAALVAVNAKTQRTGTTLTSVATGLTTVTLTWPTPWPDTAYGVYLSVITGSAALGLVAATLVPGGTKTTVDCQVTVNNTAGQVLASVGLDALGART